MQRKATVINLALAIIVLTAWTAAAQAPGGGRDQRPPTPAIDTVLDTDGDQVISDGEIAVAASVLHDLDADGDGALSFDECMGFSNGTAQQSPPNGRSGSGGQPPAPPIFSALDTSDDEIVDEYEIADAPSSLLTLDDNSDGQLQADETRPENPGGRGGGRNQPR